MEPQRSSGLLSLNDFYLSSWDNSIYKTSRCQYISVQHTDFFTWKSLTFPLKSSWTVAFCYAFQVPYKLLFPFSDQLEHKDPIFSPISPGPIKAPGIGISQKFLTVLLRKWIALGVIIYSIRIQIQLTLENHGFELCGSSYTWIFPQILTVL